MRLRPFASMDFVMGLAEYNKKRDFKKTAEPKGKVAKRKKSALSFVIQKHDASRLHYDFRLELDGVLKSWAVPKGPSLDPTKKNFAVQVEDHPLDYGDFEGTIPQGEYGGGTVMLWDRGTWEPLHDPHNGLRDGKLHFTLHGEKLNGEFTLVRMRGRAGDDEGKNWLLFKVKDKFAGKKDVLKNDTSVKTKRSMDEIADDPEKVWRGKGAKDSVLPETFSPQLAVLADKPPTGDGWVHEIKFDGYRILAMVEDKRVRLMTRNGHDWTHKFPSIADACARLKVKSAIFDGEVVVLDTEGRSDFQALQAMLKDKQKASPSYYLFDLVHLDGDDLTSQPLLKRKQQLKKVFDRSKPGATVQYSDHTAGDGKDVINQACRMSLEGIISKRANAPYAVGRRDASWLKSKCDQRQEFVIIGYSDPQGGRQHFGSLLIGYHDDQGRLVYAGRVGTGFDDRLLGDLMAQMKKIERDDPPTDIDPPSRERRRAHWVEPKLVGEVRFTGWTRDGVLRHPAFIALRTDKPASQIVREQAVHITQGGDVKTKTKATRRAKTPSPQASPKRRGGKTGAVTLTHPDKVLFPEQGVTKQAIADYYTDVSKFMLPHVTHRPLALVRCPNGRGSKCFFARNHHPSMPEQVVGVNITYGNGRPEEHVAIHDLDGVIALVQMGVLEIHTWGCRDDDIEHPDQVIFDLDPGPDVTWKRVVEAARVVKRTLDELRLPTFLKTSGGKGLHIVIPLKPTIDWDSAKEFCGTIANDLARRGPEMFVANMRKDLRGGKVYIDFHRNGRGATAVAPYSTRAREGAPVSMPISWEELGRIPSAAHFTVDTARRQLEKRTADPWRDFERSRVDLLKIASRKSAA